MYTFVTSLNKAYWNSTSKVNINSWVECLPKDVNIIIYSEENIDIGIFPEPRVSLKPLYDGKPFDLRPTGTKQNIRSCAPRG